MSKKQNNNVETQTQDSPELKPEETGNNVPVPNNDQPKQGIWYHLKEAGKGIGGAFKRNAKKIAIGAVLGIGLGVAGAHTLTGKDSLDEADDDSTEVEALPEGEEEEYEEEVDEL